MIFSGDAGHNASPDIAAIIALIETSQLVAQPPGIK
jgi:hypothetical protein